MKPVREPELSRGACNVSLAFDDEENTDQGLTGTNRIAQYLQRHQDDSRAFTSADGNNPVRQTWDAAREEMVEKSLPLVRIIVSKMRVNLPAHADCEELESAGITGLMAAVDRFDPSRGFTFETYASTRIRGAILDELRKWDMMPRSARTRLKKIEQTSEELERELGRAPTDKEMSEAMGVKEQRFRKMRARSQPISLMRLDSPQTRPDGEVNLHEIIPDEDLPTSSEFAEKAELVEIMTERMAQLPEQQQKVLALNFYEGMRLAEIGETMGVSEARISQIRSQALATLRTYLRRMSR